MISGSSSIRGMKLEPWAKGGIMGFVITVTIYLYPFISAHLGTPQIPHIIVMLSLAHGILFTNNFPNISTLEYVMIVLSGIIISTTVGMLIGFIVGKIRKRKLEQSSSGRPKGI